MTETLDYYNQNAEQFVLGTLHADMSACRARFLDHMKPGGRILDAGCGSGRDALAFQQAGFPVDAFDASPKICQMASELLGQPVACKRFEELTGKAEYDGIWACASLLHVAAKDLPNAMNRLQKLLKPGGILYASFKQGEGERIKDGRYFQDMTLPTLTELIQNAGLTPLETFLTQDVREGRNAENWVNVIGRLTEI